MADGRRRQTGRRGGPGVDHVDVQFDDHVVSAEINAGVAADVGFDGSFPGWPTGAG